MISTQAPIPKREAFFYRSASGREPVRDWLKAMGARDRKLIGDDIRTIQFGWPMGTPLVRKLDAGLWEIRTHLADGVRAQEATGRRGEGCTVRKGNPRIGSRFDDFLRSEGRLGESTALAIKRVIAFQLRVAMEAGGVSQAEMARRMKTSRAVVARLLDEADTSVTLVTISKAAAALGVTADVRLDMRAPGK